MSKQGSRPPAQANITLHRIAARLRMLLKLKGRVVAARGERER